MQSLFRATRSRLLISPSFNNIQSRNVVFVRGQRIQGLIRDPEEVLSSDGVKYGQSEETLKPLKTFLADKNVSLPDDLLLQIITHKSFAHGSKPYNEKLSYFGEEILQLTSSKSVLAHESNSDFAINKINFDGLSSLAHRLILSDKFLASYAKSKGIDSIFFCRKALPNGKQDKLYQPKAIYSTITSSLIGAIALQHGKKKAEEFIEQEIIPSYKSASN